MKRSRSEMEPSDLYILTFLPYLRDFTACLNWASFWDGSAVESWTFSIFKGILKELDA